MKIQFMNYVKDRSSQVLEAREVQLSYGRILLDSREVANFQGDMWLHDDKLWTDVVIFSREDSDA